MKNIEKIVITDISRIKGLVSAIIPTYNRREQLLDRVQEIHKQDYSNWEIIIVDDGSTDDTYRALRKIQDKRIKLIRLDVNSSSVSIPRNIGITHAMGEFIAPIDDDNVILDGKFTVLTQLLNENPDAVLAYGNRIEDHNGQFVRPTPITDWNGESHGVDNSQFIYRANVYDKLPLIFPVNACDWYVANHISSLGRFVYINQVVSIYSFHEGNRAKKKAFKQIDLSKYYHYFSNKHGYKLSDKEFPIP